MKTYMVDVSEYQGTVDWRKVEDEGFAGAAIKLSGSKSKGWYYTDPFGIRNATELLSTRMVRVAYHYLTETHPVAQCAMFLELLSEIGNQHMFGAMLDIEDPSLDSIAVNQFLTAWSVLAPGRKLVVYTSGSFWSGRMGSQSIPKNSPLVMAHWIPAASRNVDKRGDRITPTDPDYNSGMQYASQQVHMVNDGWWKTGIPGRQYPDLIQFTNNALVAGVGMDCSVFNGTKQDLAALFEVAYDGA